MMFLVERASTRWPPKKPPVKGAEPTSDGRWVIDIRDVDHLREIGTQERQRLILDFNDKMDGFSITVYDAWIE